MRLRRLMLVSHNQHYGGGAEHVLYELVKGLRQARPELSVLVVFPGQGEGALVRDVAALGAEVTTCRLPRWADFPPQSAIRRAEATLRIAVAVKQAVQVTRRWRPDVVFTNTMVIPSFAVAAARLRLPHVWAVQEFGDRDHGLQFLLGHRRTMRLLGRLSTRVVCCSEAVRKEVMRAAAPSAVDTVYCAVDTPAECVSPRPSRGSRERLDAVLVGRLSEAKGQQLALEAVAHARARGADVSLTLYGPATPENLRQVQETAERCGLGPRVLSVPGPTSDVRSAYCGAHVALMCSRDEAFGRVTVEAMKLGLPVLGSDSGGTPEIVTHGKDGFLFPAGDARALGERLAELWADEPLRARLGRAASDDANRRFTLLRYAAATLAALDASLDGHSLSG